MRKLFAITAILLLALSSVCFAEKQEWVDKNYDFSKVKAVLLWDMFVDKSLENGINEKEIIEIVREKTNIKYVKVVTPPVVMEAIKRDYGIDLEALKATNQDQVLTTFFKYLPNYVDLEISVKVLLLSPFVHALLTNLAIICSDILPQSPGGVATTDVVANRKSLWKFSRNYGADHMVIHQPLCPLCSEQQGMRA